MSRVILSSRVMSDETATTASTLHWQSLAIELARAHNVDGANQALARAADLAAASGNTRLQLRQALAHGVVFYFADHVSRSIAVLSDGKQRAIGLSETALAAEFSAALALSHLQFGHVRDAITNVFDALSLHQPADPAVSYRALLALANACQQYGVSARAFQLYQRALAAAKAAGDPVGQRSVIGRMADVQASAALLDMARGHVAAEQLRQAGVGLQLALNNNAEAGKAPTLTDAVKLAALLAEQDQFDRADALLTEWAPIRDRSPELDVRALADVTAARCRLHQGMRTEAIALAESAWNQVPVAAPTVEAVCAMALVARLNRELDAPTAPLAERTAAELLAQYEARCTARQEELKASLSIAGRADLLDT